MKLIFFFSLVGNAGHHDGEKVHCLFCVSLLQVISTLKTEKKKKRKKFAVRLLAVLSGYLNKERFVNRSRPLEQREVKLIFSSSLIICIVAALKGQRLH